MHSNKHFKQLMFIYSIFKINFFNFKSPNLLLFFFLLSLAMFRNVTHLHTHVPRIKIRTGSEAKWRPSLGIDCCASD